VRRGDSVLSDQLYRWPDGRLWTFTNPLGQIVYAGHRLPAKTLKRLPAEWNLNDATDPWVRARLFDDVAGRTLGCVVGVTYLAILTSTRPRRHERVNQPSIDYLCFGEPVTELWHKPLLSAIVRPLPTDVEEVIRDKDGLMHLMVTITPRTEMWQRVVAGQLIDDSTVTYKLKPGDRFIPKIHCEWVPEPDLPPFRPDNGEDLF
jgi:hypothetical protein